MSSDQQFRQNRAAEIKFLREGNPRTIFLHGGEAKVIRATLTTNLRPSAPQYSPATAVRQGRPKHRPQ